MEIGEGDGRAKKAGAVLIWFFMEEEGDDDKDVHTDSGPEPLEG